jgi:hypothetical protein
MTVVTQSGLFGQSINLGEVTFNAPVARRTDPATSHEAAAVAAHSASHGRLLALRTIAQHTDLTDFELADLTGWLQPSIGKRRGELMNADLMGTPWPLVEIATDEHGQVIKRPARPGATSKATAWRITPAGRAYLKEHA